jgi:hypothetical protein
MNALIGNQPFSVRDANRRQCSPSGFSKAHGNPNTGPEVIIDDQKIRRFHFCRRSAWEHFTKPVIELFVNAKRQRSQTHDPTGTEQV